MVDPSIPDGGLTPVPGVRSFQVFRAQRDVRAADPGVRSGYTYNHHVDMACWKGRLYMGWNSCERDEDTWPWRQMYSSSIDGATWSPPALLFPPEVSMALRMYFFHSPNERMLVIAGLRRGQKKAEEKLKAELVVREILSDHTLGPVFALHAVRPLTDGCPPFFEASANPGFVTACRLLLANHPFLEQQDYGNLLDPKDRMAWHDRAHWPSGKVPGKGIWTFGKASSFFHRRDGALVGVCKMGWVTISRDEGRTWSMPVAPPSLVTGRAKVWGQRTPDGRFALVYNPDRELRYPLVMVTSDDGVTFHNMQVVQGETPIRRYDGSLKDLGAEYVRGISEWANDGSRSDDAMWIVYSINKEDIWVSRIPIPIPRDEGGTVTDGFDAMSPGPFVPGWNTYSPRWAPVSVVPLPDGRKCVRLEDADPYDYARAVRTFPASTQLTATFEVRPGQDHSGSLEIEILSDPSALRPIRLILGSDGQMRTRNGKDKTFLGAYKAGEWIKFHIDASTVTGRFSISLNGRAVLTGASFTEPAEHFQRLSFRTGVYRKPGDGGPAAAGSDHPIERAVYDIREVRIVTDYRPSIVNPQRIQDDHELETKQ